jgi:hypothetical protein
MQIRNDSQALKPAATSSASLRPPVPGFRLARAGATLIMSILVCSAPLGAQSSDTEPARTLTVLVYNYAEAPPATLAAGERLANQILAAAGARADWVECGSTLPKANPKDLCQNGWTPQTPALRLLPGANKYREAEFGYSAIPILATIYYEKIARRAQRDNSEAERSVLLGCVIAHELGHLLLAEPGHSANGIMQPQWGSTQIHQALAGNLLFTKEQGTRIQSQARILASLPRNSEKRSRTP